MNKSNAAKRMPIGTFIQRMTPRYKPTRRIARLMKKLASAIARSETHTAHFVDGKHMIELPMDELTRFSPDDKELLWQKGIILVGEEQLRARKTAKKNK